MSRGLDVVTRGTDTPLLLVDLRRIGLTGASLCDSLERSGLTANKNSVPGDPQPPTVTSGIRFGVSAGTTRGFGTAEFATIGHCIGDVVAGLVRGAGDVAATEAQTLKRVSELAHAFPIYSNAER